MDDIKTLVFSDEDWNEKYNIPAYVKVYLNAELEEIRKNLYDVVFVNRNLSIDEANSLYASSKAYSLFITDDVELSHTIKKLFICRKGLLLPSAGIQSFFDNEIRNFYPKPYGEKFQPRNIIISHEFKGSVFWKGFSGVELEGDFGEQYHQILYWKNTIPIKKGQCLDMYLEFTRSEDVSLILSVSQYRAGSVAQLQQHWEFDKARLKEVFCIDNMLDDGNLFVTIKAKGKGKLSIGGLHDRYSRRGYGYFLPGGEIYKTSSGEEIFCYFDPGDMKPPLNIYFSGYKTREGFEGYNLMKNMGTPFLLIAEGRLEGGCFYMGEDEYEKLLVRIIKKYIDELGFEGSDVIMSGLSMGTTGALYYSPDVSPHAVIIGKPLASIGDVAANELHYRPGGFPTSLDVLYHITGNTDQDAIERLNKRLWDKFERADFAETTFVISYMIEDDYDKMAHDRLIEHLNSAGAKVYSKGLHGRHNDNTGGIVYWFNDRYKQIIKDDFRRDVV